MKIPINWRKPSGTTRIDYTELINRRYTQTGADLWASRPGWPKTPFASRKFKVNIQFENEKFFARSNKYGNWKMNFK
jgi:hypothetical protein